MKYTTKQQGEYAILWLEKLMTAEEEGIKQATGQLGSKRWGYCCLGYGCSVTRTKFRSIEGVSLSFALKVGLLGTEGAAYVPKKSAPKLEVICGDLKASNWIRKQNKACTSMNDTDGFSFKGISKRLQKYPHLYFIPEVAEQIKQHFGGK